MKIIEFLEARISDDEARAGRGWACIGESRWELTNYGQDILTPAGILAECAAKRELVEVWSDEHGGHHVLRALATIYKDHPDYDEKWAA